MRKELQATTEEEAPKWFQRWNQEREAKEAKKKADSSKTVLIKIAISKLGRFF